MSEEVTDMTSISELRITFTSWLDVCWKRAYEVEEGVYRLSFLSVVFKDDGTEADVHSTSVLGTSESLTCI